MGESQGTTPRAEDLVNTPVWEPSTDPALGAHGPNLYLQHGVDQSEGNHEGQGRPSNKYSALPLPPC